MRKNMIFLFFLIIVLLLSGIVFAAPKVNDLLAGIDNALDLKVDGTAKLECTEQKAGEGVKKTEMIFYDRADADNSFLIVMTAPEVDKGNGYLNQGDHMWMYRRNTRSFQHINRDESIAGTDAKAEDFEKKKLMELYKPLLKAGKETISETKLGDKPVYQFEVTARTEDVTYPHRIYWVQKDNYLPLKVQNYSLNGTLMQTVYYVKYTQIKGKYLWIKAIFVDEFDKGNKTIIELKNISIQKIDDRVFTKAYLENLSK